MQDRSPSRTPALHRLRGWPVRLTGRALPILALALAAAPPDLQAQERPPSIVLIVADDLGYGELGVQGSTDVPTPHIDALARGGVRFTDGHVTCPVCAPTRAGLLTGRYPQRFGFEHNPGPGTAAAPTFGLPSDEPTLAERLKAAGYATGMVGKWHLGLREGFQPLDRGFDRFFGFLGGGNPYVDASARGAIVRGREPVAIEDYLTDVFAREAVQFVEDHAAQPFFLYLAFNAVHSPLQATDEGRARLPEVADERRRTFGAMLLALDDAVGQVLDALARHGLTEDTLVVFLSDNGGPTRTTTSQNGPLRGFKAQMYEGGTRVPFLLRWPARLPAGVVEPRLVSALDVVPTALAAAGVEASGGKALDGVDLLPYLTGARTESPHEALFWRMGRQAAARLGAWKLVVQDGRAEVFDLAADLGEQTDLAGAQPEALARLQVAYAAWEADMVAPRWSRSEGARGARAGRRGARGRAESAPPPAPPQPDPAADLIAALLTERFRGLDGDGDGRLTTTEAADLGELFARLDADGDGFLTLAETLRAARP